MKKPKTHFHPVPTGMGFLFSGSFKAGTGLLVVRCRDSGIAGIARESLFAISLFYFFCQLRFSLSFVVDWVQLAEFTQKHGVMGHRALGMGNGAIKSQE